MTITPFAYRYFASLFIGFLAMTAHAQPTLTRDDINNQVFCALQDGYNLPKGIEFADGCEETDMRPETTLWLVQKRQDIREAKYGFADDRGHIVIPIQYDYARPFKEGLALVGIGSKRGFIDTTGKFVTQLDDRYVDSFSEGMALMEKDGKYGFIDQKNQLKIPFIYVKACSFSQGYASVNLKGDDNTWGLIDKTGKTVLPFEYDRGIYALIPNDLGWHLRATKNHKAYIFDKQAKLVFPVYQDIGFYEEGLVNVQKNDKWGFVDANNTIKIDFTYDEATGFFNGLALVKKGDKYGFINPQGRAVIPLEWDKISTPFYKDEYQSQDITLAQKNGKFYLLYLDGTSKLLNYDDVYEYFVGNTKDLIIVGKKDPKNSEKMLYGIVDRDDNVILPIKYAGISTKGFGIYANMPAVVTTDGKFYTINFKGEILADNTEEYRMLMNY